MIAGTVMHRTHLPLTVWFWAIYLFVNDKRGISAVQLSNWLGICYESAWTLLSKLRAAMRQRDSRYLLEGIIEMDDGFLGGPDRGGKRGRGSKRPKIIIALSKTRKGHPQYVHIEVAENMKVSTLQRFIDEFLAKGANVECDNFISYRNLQGVNCTPKNYEATDGDLKWLHITISNLKAFLKGTYHGRCTNLQAYLDEFCFRFNRRMHKDELFSRLVRAVATSNVC